MVELKSFFKAYGALNLDDRSYVPRDADEQLFDACMEHRACHVLAPRQAGKSSLLLRTAARLNEAGVRTAFVDVQHAEGSEEQFFYYLVKRIAEQLALDKAQVKEAWLAEAELLSPGPRFEDFVDERIADPASRCVLFFDELDSLREIEFSDVFLKTLRAIHERGARDSAFRAICIVLAGVVTPSELVRSASSTPFNVGVQIDLLDFSLDQASVLTRGLPTVADPQGIISKVHSWTGGHPRLTQVLCEAVSRSADPSPKLVDELVRSTFIELPSLAHESTFAEVERQAERPEADGWLTLYLQVLEGARLRANTKDELQHKLQIVGLVKAGDDGCLTTRNRIFAEVFDATWARARRRRDRDPIDRLVSDLRETTDPRLAFRAAVKILRRDPERLAQVIDEMEGLTLDRLFVPGAEGALAADVVPLIEALHPSATADAARAMLIASTRARGEHAKADRLHAELERTLRFSHRVTVRIVHPARSTLGTDYARALYHRLTRDAFDAALDVPIFIYSGPDGLIADDAFTPAVATQHEVIVLLLDGGAWGDPEWTETLGDLAARAQAPGSNTSLVPLSLTKPPLALPNGLSGIRVQHVERLVDASIQTLSVLNRRLRGGRNTTLFLSHTKEDDWSSLRKLREEVDRQGGIDAHVDASSLAAGDQLDSLRRNIEASVVCAFVGPTYASRVWCQQEILWARKLRSPVLVIDIDPGDVTRAYPYFGRAPVVRWDADAPEASSRRVFEMALLVAFRHEFIGRALEDVGARRSVDDGTGVLTHAPDLTDLTYRFSSEGSVDAGDSAPQTVLHPDPPVTAPELAVLRLAHPDVQLVTPSIVLARERPLRRDGRSMKVVLSASEPDHFPAGFSMGHFEDAWLRLVARLIETGAELHFGGDLRRDGLTDRLLQLALRRVTAEGGGPVVHSHLAWPIHLGKPARERWVTARLVKRHEYPPPTSTHPFDANAFLVPSDNAARYVWTRSLTTMREEMLKNVDAFVVMGGRTEGYLGRAPGVVEETLIALKLDKPVFIIGALGGAAHAVGRALRGEPSEALTARHQLARPLTTGGAARSTFVGAFEARRQEDAHARDYPAIDYDADLHYLQNTGVAGLCERNHSDARANLDLLRGASVADIVGRVHDGLHRLWTRHEEHRS